MGSCGVVEKGDAGVLGCGGGCGDGVGGGTGGPPGPEYREPARRNRGPEGVRSPPALQALRITGPVPVIDGLLDEADWGTAMGCRGFRGLRAQ